jgi:YggT family protein
MGIIALLRFIFWAYGLIIIGRVILSYLPNVSPYNPVARFLHQATEPVLAPVRQMLPPMQGIDLSPLIVLVVLQIIQRLFL